MKEELKHEANLDHRCQSGHRSEMTRQLLARGERVFAGCRLPERQTNYGISSHTSPPIDYRALDVTDDAVPSRRRKQIVARRAVI